METVRVYEVVFAVTVCYSLFLLLSAPESNARAVSLYYLCRIPIFQVCPTSFPSTVHSVSLLYTSHCAPGPLQSNKAMMGSVQANINNPFFDFKRQGETEGEELAARLLKVYSRQQM